MTNTKKALERVILELDSWCNNWTPTSYNDPRISLRQIADRARDVLHQEKMTGYQPTPQTPEQVDQGLRAAMRQAKENGVFDVDPKPMDEVVERLVKKHQAQKLYNRLLELGYDKEDCDYIVDLVEDWLPKPQSATGSQNVDTELLVDGFNHCVQKMKEMLR